MDNKETQYKIEVMQHWAKGGTIQVMYKHDSDPRWVDRLGSKTAPSWNWTAYDYRIKPAHRYLRDDSSTIWRTMEEWQQLERNG